MIIGGRDSKDTEVLSLDSLQFTKTEENIDPDTEVLYFLLEFARLRDAPIKILFVNMTLAASNSQYSVSVTISVLLILFQPLHYSVDCVIENLKERNR